MMKYGKKNEVKVDPLAFNLALIGESGIGKTTIIKEYCEKLAGDDGYIFLELGKEDGADAINGINYLNCPEWDMDYEEETNSIGFNTFVEDVIENRSTDWKDLKVVVIDTCDELFAIAEPEVIRMHNRANPNKKVQSIKAAFGGFQAGEDKTVEIVLNALWSLKKVGVSFIVIGHTKSKNVTDSITGEDYAQLTTNMPQKYFNAIKTKVHFLGVAAIDRNIVKKNTGKKDIATKKDILRGVVTDETRKITFRDDNYVIDSKSRFADIVDSIPMDSDSLIKAVEDAIEKELKKSGKTKDDVFKEQEKKHNERLKHIAEKEEENRQLKKANEIIGEWKPLMKEIAKNGDKEKAIKINTFIKENNIDIKNMNNCSVDILQELLDLTKSII